MTILKGENFSLMRFESRHLTQRYVGWLNNPVVAKYSELRHRVHSLDTCQAYLDSFPKNSGEIGSKFAHEFLAIVAHYPDLGHIGNISISVDRDNSVADLSILIGERRARNKGFGLAAWNLLMDHLLATVGMRKATAGTMSVNIPMLRIMEKSGMKSDGRRKNQFLIDGKTVDLVYAAKFRK